MTKKVVQKFAFLSDIPYNIIHRKREYRKRREQHLTGKGYQRFKSTLSEMMEQRVRELSEKDDAFLLEERKEEEAEQEYLKLLPQLPQHHQSVIEAYLRQKDTYMSELMGITYLAGMLDMHDILRDLNGIKED